MQAYYVRQIDTRGELLILLATVPVILTVLVFPLLFPFCNVCLVLSMVLFRPFAVRPLAVHLSAGGRFMTGLVMTFLKLLVLAPLVFLSVIPCLGLLPVLPLFAGRYLFVRAKFLRRMHDLALRARLREYQEKVLLSGSGAEVDSADRDPLR